MTKTAQAGTESIVASGHSLFWIGRRLGGIHNPRILVFVLNPRAEWTRILFM